MWLLLALVALLGGARAQYDADPWHPTYSLAEISNAQGACMYACLRLQQRPEKACLTEMGLPGYWACQLSNPATEQRQPCKNQMRFIELSSVDCSCVRTSTGRCVSPFEINADVWRDVPFKYRGLPRVRTQA